MAMEPFPKCPPSRAAPVPITLPAPAGLWKGGKVGQAWKGPLEITQTNLTAKAGSPGHRNTQGGLECHQREAPPLPGQAAPVPISLFSCLRASPGSCLPARTKSHAGSHLMPFKPLTP